jgi:hypothetical protein
MTGDSPFGCPQQAAQATNVASSPPKATLCFRLVRDATGRAGTWRPALPIES